MPSFTNQGINLHYRDRGAGEAVIFLHEFGGDARSWDYQMNYRATMAAFSEHLH